MTPSYLLDAPGEGARLIAKVDPSSWADRYIRGLAVKGPILEVGAGPMHLIKAVVASTRQAGVAVDISLARLQDGARRTWPDPEERSSRPGSGNDVSSGRDREPPAPVCGEATRLPLRASTFGLSYARFLLEYLPDPAAAVLEMARVTRPGGRVFLQDLDGQLLLHYPVDPELQAALEHFVTKTQGRFDPNVGRKLFSCARNAGLKAITVQLEPYHLIAGAADDATLALWDAKLTHALPAATDALGPSLAALTKQRFMHYLADPDTLTYSNLFTIIGCVPAEP